MSRFGLGFLFVTESILFETTNKNDQMGTKSTSLLGGNIKRGTPSQNATVPVCYTQGQSS